MDLNIIFESFDSVLDCFARKKRGLAMSETRDNG